jgi:hypothetical protein
MLLAFKNSSRHLLFVDAHGPDAEVPWAKLEAPRIADGHFDGVRVARRGRISRAATIPTHRWDAAGGFYSHAPPTTVFTPKATQLSRTVSDLLADDELTDQQRATVEIIGRLTTALQERCDNAQRAADSAEARVAELQRAAAQTVEWAVNPYGGLTPCLRLERVEANPNVCTTLFGFTGPWLRAFYRHLNAGGIVDGMKLFNATAYRQALRNWLCEGVAPVAVDVAAPADAAGAPVAAEVAAAFAALGAGGGNGNAAGVGAPAANGAAEGGAGGAAAAAEGPVAAAPVRRRLIPPSVQQTSVAAPARAATGRTRTLTGINMVAMTLFILRTASTMEHTAWAWGCSTTTVTSVFISIVTLLDKWLEIEFPPFDTIRAKLVTPIATEEKIGANGAWTVRM